MHFSRKKQALLLGLLGLLVAACGQDYSPKPKGFPRIDLPAHAYRPLGNGYPYFFEYSKYAVIKPDTFRKAEPYWIFVDYPSLRANIQLTYKPVLNDPARLRGFISDAYKLSAKHQEKAYAIGDKLTTTPTGKTVVFVEIAGDVPSHYQFFTSDSTTHYLRGALYLRTATENDSLAPIVEYLKKDVEHLVNTLQWREMPRRPLRLLRRGR